MQTLKVKYVDIQRTIVTNHNEGHDHDRLIDIRTIKLWWDRRHECWPPHPAFSTEEKRNEVIECALEMPLGYQQKDVMNRFNIMIRSKIQGYSKEKKKIVCFELILYMRIQTAKNVYEQHIIRYKLVDDCSMNNYYLSQFQIVSF